MSRRKRADAHVIRLHALHITRIKDLDGRRKAIAIFEDEYDSEAARTLKEEVKRIWDTRPNGRKS